MQEKSFYDELCKFYFILLEQVSFNHSPTIVFLTHTPILSLIIYLAALRIIR